MEDEDAKSVLSSTASGVGSSVNHTQNLAMTEEQKLLATAKNRRIVCMRVLFVIFWLASASLVSWAVYSFVSDDQNQDFKESFQVQASKVVDRFLMSMENDLAALATISTSITSFAASTGANFPNVTLRE